jgi:hypothetical protein
VKVRTGGLLLLLALLQITCSAVEAQGTTAILADPADPYHTLAEEMAQVEGLPILHNLDEALARQPTTLLWVASPSHLSDQVMIDFGLAMRDRRSAVSTGIITGATLQDARALWQRAGQAQGDRAVIANAGNTSGHIEAGITAWEGSTAEYRALTKPNLIESLQWADYLTFTGHGSSSYLRLGSDTTLRAADLPALPPAVVATGSCNTFRPWEEESIALAFVQQGAAAYAGFVYSPNSGYLMGAFDGLPFRYTWPEFPIGHAVQAQNRGTMQGFASLPFYHLLGDPRLALQAEAPYRLAGVQAEDGSQTQRYVDAPAGVIPVRVPGGAGYAFVEVPGVGMAWRGEPFYNARLQMIDIGEDKYLLLEHQGGDFSLHLRERPPWLRVAADVALDALDGTLLFLPGNGGTIFGLVVGTLALGIVALRLIRRQSSPRALLPAALTGLAFGLLHGLYALARLEQVSVTSKGVEFSLLAPATTAVLVACGAFFFLQAASWRGRVVAVSLATVGALVPAAFLLLFFGVADEILMGHELGAGLWNCRLGLQPLIAAVLGAAVLGPVFHLLRKRHIAKTLMKEDIAHV